MELALILLFITLFLIFIKPKYMGYSAVLMAIVAFFLNVVNLKDVVEVIDIVWDATLTFIGIIILSLVLEEIGFFDWAAVKIAKFSKGSGILMFVYSMLLGAVISALFSSDSAVLILTPILISKMQILKLNKKTFLAFVLAGGFMANTGSFLFVFSNLPNIITADYFDIGFIEYFKHMFLPSLVAIFVSVLFLFLYFKNNIPKKVNLDLLPECKSVIKNKKLFNFSWFFLALLFTGFVIGDFYHIPVSFFALGGALLFLIIAYFTGVVSFKVLKKAPWQILWFSIGLYVVVFGLKDAGITSYLHEIIKNSNALEVGFLSAGLSGILNNLPSVMIMDMALKGIEHQALVYANIIGTNIGPKLTPFGALSTLLWFNILRKKGIKITFFEYIKFGIVITPIVLFFTLLILEV